ncbi:MAG: DsrE family protein [Nitrospinota bacterium]|nr:DsrE family protein [Nitrospinota bacterium]MDH5757228.1 DsrE family protein [Nitrospinota bacterium]
MGKPSLLIIISSPPYNGSDAAWNSLRLAKTAAAHDDKVRVFLINEGTDIGRQGLQPPENFFNLTEMLAETVAAGVEVQYCKTCIDRCGVGEGEMIQGIAPGSMAILHEWIMTSDKVVTF